MLVTVTVSVEVAPNSTYTEQRAGECECLECRILTVIVGVGAADGGRILAGLPRRREAVGAGARRRGRQEPGERLEVEPQLAHVRGHLRGKYFYNVQIFLQ